MAVLARFSDRTFRVPNCRAENSRNRPTGGSGQGLAIVNQLVGTYGGRVRVESQVGSESNLGFPSLVYNRVPCAFTKSLSRLQTSFKIA